MLEWRFTKEYMKKAVFIFIYWMLIIQYLLTYVGGEVFNVFDKLFVAVGALFIVPNYNKINNSAFYLLILLFIVGLLGTLKFNYVKNEAVLNDIFLFIKFAVSLFCGYLYGTKQNTLSFELQYIRIYTPYVASIFFLLSFVNQFFDIFPRYDEQLGPIKTVQLFFGHCTFMAATIIFYISLFISTIRKRLFDLVIMMMLVFSVLCTTRMKAIAAILLIILLLLKYYYTKQLAIKKIEYILFGLFLLMLSMDKLLSYFVDNADYARGLLFFTSIEIAKDHFPIGAGIGSFASSGSEKFFSPLYIKYGILYDKLFANDSFWATVIAQFGFIGFLLFLLLLFILVKSVFTLQNYSRLFMSALILVSYLIICSIAEVSFVAVYAVPMAFWLGILLGYKNMNLRLIRMKRIFKK